MKDRYNPYTQENIVTTVLQANIAGNDAIQGADNSLNNEINIIRKLYPDGGYIIRINTNK